MWSTRPALDSFDDAQALRARRIIQMAASQPSFLVVLCLILAALMGSARGQDAAAPAPAELQLGSPNLAPESAADAAAPAPAADMAASAPAPEAAEAPAPEADTEAPAPAPVEISAVTATAARRDGPPPSKPNQTAGATCVGWPFASYEVCRRSSDGTLNPHAKRMLHAEPFLSSTASCRLFHYHVLCNLQNPRL